MKLGVNVDHVATLRQARNEDEGPDPVLAAKVCQKAGASAIVMHLREDRRHVQDKDLFRLKQAISIKLNMEMSIAPSVVKTAGKLHPDQITIVPERRAEKTTESGLDLFKRGRALRKVIETFKAKGTIVSLFIDPTLKQLEQAGRFGVDAVEFHTGTYANQRNKQRRKAEFERIRKAVKAANEMGIDAHAGHGLDYENVAPFTKIQGLDELNIGYSIIGRAVWVGLEEAVREMMALIKN